MKITPITCILGFLCLGLHAEDAESDVPTIYLFTRGMEDKEGLKVFLKPTEYQGIKTEKVEFSVLIMNLLQEEVFVEVTQLGEASISVEGDAGFMFNGGGGRIVFPDNAPLLKRLHSTKVLKDGKRFTCGCALVTVKQSAEIDLSEWIGCTGTLAFEVSGFYRSTGKRFKETIDLKFNITEPRKSEQGGAQ